MNMSESENCGETPDSMQPGETLLRFDERVQHFAAGYNNSQSVVRFLDTKASAVIGTIPVILALLAGFASWLERWWNFGAMIDAVGGCIVVLISGLFLAVAGILLYYAVVAVVSAFAAIAPQDIGDTRPSLLFPFASSSQPAQPHEPAGNPFEARAELFVRGATREDALEDYRRQVVRMGQILKRKIRHVNDAVDYLKRLFVSAFALVLLLCLFTIANAVVAHINAVTASV